MENNEDEGRVIKMFTLPPKDTENFIRFKDKEHKIGKLFDWGLITETAKKKQMIKEFQYCGSDMVSSTSCDVVGYIPYNNEPDSPDTAVILVEGQLDKIMPAYLKEMQIGSTKPNLMEETSQIEKKAIIVHTKNKIISHSHMEYDFVAIDFETANDNLNSACSIGIVAVNNNQIIKKRYYLIKPPIVRFDKKNIEIHGITEKDVEDQADFKGIWNKIEPYIANNLLVAHNATFDMSVLKCCMQEYNISVPDIKYVCSIPVSTYAFNVKVGNSLAERTKLLGIELENAHNALDDAVACAELVIQTLQINNKTSLHKFLAINRDIDVKSLRKLNQMTTFGKRENKLSKIKPNIRIADLNATVDVIDEKNPIFGKVFIFTGEMESISREDAMQMVINLGGVIKSGVSKKANYVVIGKQDLSLVGQDGISGKQKKAQEYINQGIEINIIDEQQFIELLGDSHDN